MPARRLIAKQAREWPEKLGNDITAFRSNLYSTIQVDRLSNLSEDIGLITSGEFRVGNGAEPDSGFTGGRMAWPQMTYGGSNFFLVGVANDALQVGLNLDDGKLYAGGGVVVLDTDGIVVLSEAVSAAANVNSYKFKSGNSVLGGLYDYIDPDVHTIQFRASAVSNRSTYLEILSRAETGNAAQVFITAKNTPTITAAYIDLSLDSGGTGTLTISGETTFLNRVGLSTFLNLKQSGTLVIDAGSITATGTRHLVDGSGAATQTDLETINGLNDGDLIILGTVVNARDVKLRHNATNGNLILNNNVDRILGLRNDMFVGMYQTNTCKVLEWGRIG